MSVGYHVSCTKAPRPFLVLLKLLLNQNTRQQAPVMSEPPVPPSPAAELQGLLRLLDALDSAEADPSSLLQRGQPPIPGSFEPPPTYGHHPPRSILNRERPDHPQAIVYDLSSIPPQDRGLEIALLIAFHLSGGPGQSPRRSGARSEGNWSQRGLPNPSSSNPNRNNRLRRRQSTRKLLREPWALEGLGIGRMGVHNRAGLGRSEERRVGKECPV